MHRPRVCFIGGGPCTLSTLHFLKDYDKIDFVVYEKQKAIGGMWQEEGNWRVGVDEYGQPTHHSMYKDLWSNGPKECLEFPDWTFRDCFTENIPSFPPRVILAEYILSRAKKDGLEKYIQLNTVVKYVDFNESNKTFNVTIENLKTKHTSTEVFDYVVVASGHFSTPNVPEFEGIENFSGRVLHSHDYRSGFEFVGQDILVVGSSYSAEDITLQTLKFGAKSVTVSYRNNPMKFDNWPKSFKGQKPLIKNIRGNTVTFIDGSKGEFDSILLCTGYLHYFPFLSPKLRLETPNLLYPPLYKGVVFPGNTQLFYLGMQDLYYTFTLFDIQGLWLTQHLNGKQPLPSTQAILNDITIWQEREKIFDPSEPHWKSGIDLQSDYINELVALTGYGYNLDCRELFYAWEKDKHDNIVTYRDKPFTSMFTNEKSPVHHTQWWHAFDDSREAFMDQKRNAEPGKPLNYRQKIIREVDSEETGSQTNLFLLTAGIAALTIIVLSKLK